MLNRSGRCAEGLPQRGSRPRAHARGAGVLRCSLAGRAAQRPDVLQSFYESLGFIAVGEPYLEDDIPHIEMLRTGVGGTG